jgi:C-terminal processing protease CtpA/Prc
VIEHERITSLRVADPSRSPLLEAAGFRVGDRVVSIDGVAVGERRGWRAPGGRLAVYEVLRGERLMVLAVR